MGRGAFVAGERRLHQADPAAATRTVLELVGELMEESFAVMGEGHILGTMPAYLERFGSGNARYVRKHFLADGDVVGPKSALSPMNVVSDVTQTEYDLLDTSAGLTKRLHKCEFQPAFAKRGEFPRAMMCMLHRAAYQGSVNGLVDGEQFDVQLTRRILFGDETCDFVVMPRDEPSPKDTQLPMATAPGEEQRQDLAYHFYTFILTSFVDYITAHLPEATVEQMLRNVAGKVGAKLHAIRPEGMDDPEDILRFVLIKGGRTVDGCKVTACPQADHIRATAKAAGTADEATVVANACRLCKHVVGGAVRQAGADVGRTTSIALGDDSCDFEVTHGG